MIIQLWPWLFIHWPEGSVASAAKGPYPPGPCLRTSSARLMPPPERFAVLIPHFQSLPIFYLGSEKPGLVITGDFGAGYFQGIPLFDREVLLEGKPGRPQVYRDIACFCLQTTPWSGCPGRLAIPSCHNFPGSPPVPSLSSASGDRTPGGPDFLRLHGVCCPHGNHTTTPPHSPRVP